TLKLSFSCMENQFSGDFEKWNGNDCSFPGGGFWDGTGTSTGLLRTLRSTGKVINYDNVVILITPRNVSGRAKLISGQLARKVATEREQARIKRLYFEHPDNFTGIKAAPAIS